MIWILAGSSPLPAGAFVRFERSRGLPEDLIHRINATNPLENPWARLERGEIDRGTFDPAFAAEAARMLIGGADGGEGPSSGKLWYQQPCPVRSGYRRGVGGVTIRQGGKTPQEPEA